jgi:RNA polymerase primary sigma factor
MNIFFNIFSPTLKKSFSLPYMLCKHSTAQRERRGIDMAKKNEFKTEQDELLTQDWDTSLDSGAMLDSVKEYLQEIGQYQLLTAEEEQSLSTQIRAGLDAAQLLEEEKPEDPESLALLRSLVRQGEEAQEQMVKANLRLVVLVAKKYLNRGLSLLDLIQEGNIGLMKAAAQYRGDKGARFSTYATWWIRQGISRAITDHSRTIRLPSHIFHQVAHLRKASRELAMELNREPTEEELALRLQTTVKKVKQLRRYGLEVSSLDMTLSGDEDGFTLGDVAGSVSPMDEVDDRMSRSALSGVLAQVLETLPDRQRYVLSLRYGLLDGRCYTLDEVGHMIGLTRERVRQIERKALSLLRTGDCARQLAGFTA